LTCGFFGGKVVKKTRRKERGSHGNRLGLSCYPGDATSHPLPKRWFSLAPVLNRKRDNKKGGEDVGMRKGGKKASRKESAKNPKDQPQALLLTHG